MVYSRGDYKDILEILREDRNSGLLFFAFSISLTLVVFVVASHMTGVQHAEVMTKMNETHTEELVRINETHSEEMDAIRQQNQWLNETNRQLTGQLHNATKERNELKMYLELINLRGTEEDTGKFQRMLKEYDTTPEQLAIFIKNKPDYFNWHYASGILNIFTGNYDEAIDDFDDVIQLNNNSAPAYNNRGFAYYKKGSYDKAIEDYTKAINITPDYKEAYHNRGNVYIDKEEYENAINDYNKAIDIDSNYSFAYNGRGLVHLYNTSYDNAISDFTEAINRSDETLAAAYYHRGIAYFDKGGYNNHTINDLNKSIDDLNKAIELNFKKSDMDTYLSFAYYHLGSKYLNNHDLTSAIQNLDKSIELYPHSAAYNNRGFAHLYNRSFNKALQDFKIAISLDSNNSNMDWTWVGKGVALEQLHKTDESIECYKTALEINSENIEAQKGLKRLLNS